MNVYTYQIGAGTGSDITTLSYSQALFAGSLMEAIDKAKAITYARAARENENTVRLIEEFGPDSKDVWVRPIEEVRNT